MTFGKRLKNGFEGEKNTRKSKIDFSWHSTSISPIHRWHKVHSIRMKQKWNFRVRSFVGVSVASEFVILNSATTASSSEERIENENRFEWVSRTPFSNYLITRMCACASVWCFYVRRWLIKTKNVANRIQRPFNSADKREIQISLWYARLADTNRFVFGAPSPRMWNTPEGNLFSPSIGSCE